ncbi:MAG: DUF2752 domain-containing protein [Planctomycetota bacterium]|jgi:hypothetical protein
MRIELIHVSRRPAWPLWAVLVVLLWSGLGAAAALLSAHLGRPVELCLLRRITGVACPTCGFTRGTLSFLHGHIARAWLYNPLLFSGLLLFFSIVALRVVFARNIRANLTKAERTVAWIVAGVLFFANWAYVILCVG